MMFSIALLPIWTLCFQVKVPELDPLEMYHCFGHLGPDQGTKSPCPDPRVYLFGPGQWFSKPVLKWWWSTSKQSNYRDSKFEPTEQRIESTVIQILSQLNNESSQLNNKMLYWTPNLRFPNMMVHPTIICKSMTVIEEVHRMHQLKRSRLFFLCRILAEHTRTKRGFVKQL